MILHGLLGSSRNWHTVAQSLAGEFSVVTVDLRNHGQSPHAGDMDYAHLVADVCALIRQRRSETVHLLGHSLGGKVAMALALSMPHLVKTLIVVDIAPVAYRDRYSTLLQTLKRVDLTAAGGRTAIDRDLSRSIPEPGLRRFLLTNLASESGGYRWRVNLEVVENALPELLSFPQLSRSARFVQPALFIAGARSDYIRPQHRSIIRHLFPEARFEVIGDAGHWPHFDNPLQFTESVRVFLRGTA